MAIFLAAFLLAPIRVASGEWIGPALLVQFQFAVVLFPENVVVDKAAKENLSDVRQKFELNSVIGLTLGGRWIDVLYLNFFDCLFWQKAMFDNPANGNIFRKNRFITNSPINAFEESWRSSVVFNSAMHVLRIAAASWSAAEDIRAFGVDDGLSIEICRIGGLFGRFQAFADEPQLREKQADLHRTNEHEKRGYEGNARVRMPPYPVLFVMELIFGAVIATATYFAAMRFLK